MEPLADNTLVLKRMGIDTHEEPIIYMRADCHVCRSEGFSAHSRITVTTERASIIATLNMVRDGFVLPTEAGLSEAAWRLLDARPGQIACLSHPRPVESLGAVRAKIFGHTFQDEQLVRILQDMKAGRYTDIDLSAFLRRRPAGEPDNTNRGVDRGGSRRLHSEDVVPRHHVAGGHCRRDGNAGSS
jgi:thymidine phosphorylase